MKYTLKRKENKWDEDICEKELESKPRLPIYRKFIKKWRGNNYDMRPESKIIPS